jgi:hypothetical protein
VVRGGLTRSLALLAVAVLLGGLGAWWQLGRGWELAADPEAANAVLLHVRKGGAYVGPTAEEALRSLETRLAYALEASGTGRLDGHEERHDEWMIWLYGPSADDVLGVVRPTLDAAGLPAGSWANKRYGPAADRGARK